MRPSRFIRFAASSLLLVFAFVHNATAQTDSLSAEIQPVVEQYFRAIAAGDTDTAFALTSFITYDQSSAEGLKKGLQMMRGIKALIDANGGLRHVENLSEPAEQLMAHTWVVVVFNNGRRETSAKIRMVKTRDGHWRVGDYVAMGFMSGLQEFYYAIANGDTEKALTWVSFERTKAQDMISRREHMLWVMDIIKQQMDANGGLNGVGPSPSGGMPEFSWDRDVSDDMSIAIQLFFNNGRTERSLPISMVVFYDRDGLWRLDAERGEYRVLPVAFLNEIEELVKSSYQTAFSGDVAELIENSVFVVNSSNTTTVKQERDRWLRLMESHITQMRRQAEANGGLKRVEIGGVGISLPSFDAMAYSMIVGGPRLDAHRLVGGAGVTLVYNNDKTADGSITLRGNGSGGNRVIFHQGRWKLVHGLF